MTTIATETKSIGLRTQSDQGFFAATWEIINDQKARAISNVPTSEKVVEE